MLAQVRPVTGQTNYPQDLVGNVVDEVERPLARAAAGARARSSKGDTTALGSKERVRVQCIPVRNAGRIIGIVTREEPMTLARRSGELERTYFETFDRFARMIADGTFPFDVDEIEMESAPRVGDGVIVIDADTRVRFASPNAVSSLHRMGIHAYAQTQRLADVGFDDAAARSAMLLHLPVAEEIERDDVSVADPCPAAARARPSGSARSCCIRDVSDLRRRDRMLLSKDATIREIHHRVKNNLQTIASLLRLQGRRLRSPEARAALAESERRIRSIAIVHETLSREDGRRRAVQRDRAAAGAARRGDRVVARASRSGSASRAMPASCRAKSRPRSPSCSTSSCRTRSTTRFPRSDGRGRRPRRGDARARRRARRDRGARQRRRASPSSSPSTASRGLGLSIVQALVTSELQGSIEMHDDHGTSVRVRVPVEMPRVEL